jgi:hypothetical protein
MSVNKDVVYFDERAYNDEREKFDTYLIAQENVRSEVNNICGTIDIDWDDPMQSVKDYVLKQYEEKDVFGLSFHKLADLLEIDLKPLNESIVEFQNCQVILEPQREDFTQYAKTKEHKERLRLSMGLIRQMETIKENGWGHVYGHTFAKSFTVPPIWMNQSMEWRVNPRFVFNDVR